MESFGFPRQYTIPTLDEIISPHTHLTDCGPYNRGSFVHFLSNSHCMENLEFVVELDRFLQNSHHAASAKDFCDDSIRDHDRLNHQWLVIFRVFLRPDAIKEVNVSYQIRRNLHEEVIPPHKELLHIRSLIYELLLDSFNEFVNYTRESTNDRTTRRRRLEIVPPEFKTSGGDRSNNYAVVFENVPRSLFLHLEHRPSQLSAQWDKALDELEQSKDAVGVQTHSVTGTDLVLDLPRSRTALAGTISTRTSSRGSSIGSLVDNIKDYSGWKTMKKLRFRRSSNDHDLE